jgi:hypothetical protein
LEESVLTDEPATQPLPSPDEPEPEPEPEVFKHSPKRTKATQKYYSPTQSLSSPERSELKLLRKQKALMEELEELNETYQAKKAKLEKSIFVVKVLLNNFNK